MIAESLTNNLQEHIEIFLAGSTALGIVSHAVNTFPTPQSAFGKWLLGLVQFVVGQRVQASQTMTKPAPEAQKAANA